MDKKCNMEAQQTKDHPLEYLATTIYSDTIAMSAAWSTNEGEPRAQVLPTLSSPIPLSYRRVVNKTTWPPNPLFSREGAWQKQPIVRNSADEK